MENSNNINSISDFNLVKKVWICIPCRILLFIAAFIILLLIFINPILSGFVKPKIVSSINESGKINISINDLSYNIFTNTLTAENISAEFNDSLSKSLNSLKFRIENIKLDEINWFSIIASSGLTFETLQINDVNASVNKISPIKENTTAAKDSSKNSFFDKIIKSIPSRLKPLGINNILINSVLINQKINGKYVYTDSLNSLELRFSSMKIDSSVLRDSLSLKFASEAKLILNGLLYHLTNDYLIKINSLNVTSADSTIVLKDFSYKPYISDAEFFSHRKYRSDLYNIVSPFLSINGINFKGFVWNGDVIIKTISSEKMYMSILTNKTVPFDSSSIPKMPNEILRSLERKINIEQIDVKKMDLYVKGKQPKIREYSEIKFTDINADISNLSNIASLQNDKNPCVLNTSTYLADAGKLTVLMRVPLLSDNLSLSYEGRLSSMSVLPLNNQLKQADLTELTSGKIDSVDFTVDILKGIARSYVVPIYEDLEIKVLEEDASEGGVSEGVSTFIANAFAIRDSNPNESGEVKKGSVVYIRKKYDTFMDVVWSALKKALGKVVGF